MVQGLAPELNLLASCLAILTVVPLAFGVIIYGVDNNEWKPAAFLLTVSAVSASLLLLMGYQ